MPYETVESLRVAAQRRLPRSGYQALQGGIEAGVTMQANVQAWGEVGFAPRAIGMSATQDLRTSVMNQELALPLILSPAGSHGVHPDAEVAVARAAKAKGIPFGLSTFATKPIEDVAAVHDGVLFQVYWIGSRSEIRARVERARAAGAKGLILTTDWSFGQGRDWGSPKVPRRRDMATMVRFAPEALARPRWTYDFLKHRALPDFTVPNLKAGRDAPKLAEAFDQWRRTPPPTWLDVEWLADVWNGPFMLKGLVRVDEAKRAAASGVTTISVSNHGGFNLDGTPATARVLAPIVDAVGPELEVVVDGGVRRGADIARAKALGARAVMVGRPYLWALAADGQRGVENAIDIFQVGLESTLRALGHTSVAQLEPEDLVVPKSFSLTVPQRCESGSDRAVGMGE